VAALNSSPEAGERLERLAHRTDEAPWLTARLAQFRRETEHVVPGALAAVSAVDGSALGRWAVESQQGAETALRNQVPETSFLARAAMASGAHAASAFGAGFGGAVWAITNATDSEAVLKQWKREYARAFPARASKSEWMTLRPAAGLRWLTEE
jgi:galactokinase